MNCSIKICFATIDIHILHANLHSHTLHKINKMTIDSCIVCRLSCFDNRINITATYLNHYNKLCVLVYWCAYVSLYVYNFSGQIAMINIILSSVIIGNLANII